MALTINDIRRYGRSNQQPRAPAVTATAPAWKEPVVAASSTNVSLAAAGTRMIDGRACAPGDRVLLPAQTAPAQNGLYVVGGDLSLSRAPDADSARELLGAIVEVLEGDTNADRLFVCTTDNIELGMTPLVFTPVGGGTDAELAELAAQVQSVASGDLDLTYDEDGLVETESPLFLLETGLTLRQHAKLLAAVRNKIIPRCGTLNDTAAVNAAQAEANANYLAGRGPTRVAFVYPTTRVDTLNPKAGVHYDGERTRLIKRVDSSVSAPSLIYAVENGVGGSYYGKYAKMRFSGFDLDPDGKTCYGSFVRLLWTEDLVIEGMTWLDYAPTALDSPWLGVWALNVGGRGVLIDHPTIRGGSVVTDDGIHFVHGQDCRIIAPDVHSGDDMIAVGPISTASLVAENDAIRDVMIQGVVGKSSRGHAIRVHIEAGQTGPGWGVQNIVVDGVAARAGIERNAGFYFVDENHPALGAAQLRHVILANADIRVGGATHDDVNAMIGYIRSAHNVRVSGTMAVTENPGAANGFDGVLVRDSDVIDLDIRASAGYGRRHAVNAQGSRDVTIRNGRFPMAAAATRSAVLFNGVENGRLLDTEITDVRDGFAGVQLVGTTTPTTVAVRGSRIARAAGATTDVAFLPQTGAARLSLEGGNDFSGVSSLGSLAALKSIADLTMHGDNKGLPAELTKTVRDDDFTGVALPTTWRAQAATYDLTGLAFTATAVDDVFTTASPHGLAADKYVVFNAGASLPVGITPGVPYFVRTVPTSTTFTLAGIYAGPVVDISTDGSGTVVVSQAAVPPAIVPDQADGIVRLVAGNTPGIADGSILDESRVWRASNGGLVFEARPHLVFGNGVRVFIGLVKQKGGVLTPFVFSADVPTRQIGVTDAIGFMYDAGATTKVWWGVSVANSGAAAAPRNLLTPVFGSSSTRPLLRFELTPAGEATFKVNGVQVGAVLTGAVLSTALLARCAVITSTTTGLTRGPLDIDRLRVEQYRV